MLSFELALLFWLLWAGGLGYWCRPTGEERAALVRGPTGSLRAILLPFAAGRDALSAVERRHFLAFRRRAWLSAAAALLPGLALLLLSGLTEPMARPPAPAPVANSGSAPVRPAPAPAPQKQAVKRSAMPQPEPAASVLGGATVTQEDQEALSEHRTPTRLYADARVRPVYANEDLLGVKVLGIVPGSFWDQVGFREGDVVLEVNGELVDDPTASVHFMNSLSRQHELILRVRGEDGEERILEHRLPRNL